MIQQKVVCFRNRRKKNFGKQLVKNNYLSLEKKLERLIVEQQEIEKVFDEKKISHMLATTKCFIDFDLKTNLHSP